MFSKFSLGLRKPSKSEISNLNKFFEQFLRRNSWQNRSFFFRIFTVLIFVFNISHRSKLNYISGILHFLYVYAKQVLYNKQNYDEPDLRQLHTKL